MLGEENWSPSAAEALYAGLIDEVVDDDQLLARATALVRERVASGGQRRFDAVEHTRLRAVNADESARVANAFVAVPFLDAMISFNTRRKKPQLSRFFLLAKLTLPLWKPADIEPNYDFEAIRAVRL